MTMKTKKTLQHIATVAAVLLTLLVFTAPVAGEYEIGCDSNQCAHSHVHVAEHAGKYYTDTNDQMRGAIHAISGHPTDKTLTIIGTVTSKIDLSPLGSSGSGIIIEGSENGLMKGSSGTPNGVILLENTANLANVVIKNLKFENGKFAISTSATSLSNLLIENCTFTGPYSPMSTGDGSAAISFNFDSGEIPYDGLVIRNNTISNYNQGISFNGKSTAAGTITIEKNIISTTGHNTIIISGSLPAKYVIQNNELTSTNNRPLNLAGITDGSKLTITGNTITFPETYNSGESTPAIYHVKGSIVLDSSNKFFYTGETKKDVTAYSSLMKHLYLDNNGAAIYVDSVKDDSGYYGGYVSVGFAKGTENPTADLTTLDIKSGYSLAKLHQNEDDGIGCHYIIGIGAESNSDMKLTAGTFAVDPTAFIADGYHVKADGSNYVVEKDEFGISASDVGFDSVKVGYTQPDAKEVTVTNTGNLPVTLIAPVTSDKYIIGTLPTIQPGQYATFTIQPVAGLAVGNYEETITVTTAEGEETTFKVSFLVYQPSSGGSNKPVEEPEEPVVEPEVPTEEPVAGEATVETEVTDGGEVELETPTAGGSAAADEDEAKITGVVLPTGTDSEVTFVPVSEQAAPAGKETQTKKVFEINVPSYEKGKAAVIKFTMTVAELAADGKEAADVALWHFDEETGEWTKLVTSYTIVDGVVYFEAITNDFSPFAIVYEDEPVDEPVDEPETPASPAPVLAVLAGLGAAVVLRRK